MYKAIALGKLKLSLSDFYELTPLELAMVLDRFERDRMDYFDMHHIANYVGFGQANSGKKFKAIFTAKEKKSKVRRVTDEQKFKDLADIQNKLRGG